jgi:hypothetical protein
MREFLDYLLVCLLGYFGCFALFLADGFVKIGGMCNKKSMNIIRKYYVDK